MTSERELTLVFTDRGMLLSTEAWRGWREVQKAIPDYKTSLDGYTVDSLFEYLSFDYGSDSLPFDRSLVELFVAGDGSRLWAVGDGWGDLADRPADLTVRDQFDVTGRGLILAVEPALPIDAPLGDHQVKVTTPAGATHPTMVRMSLVHFNPGGYRIEVLELTRPR